MAKNRNKQKAESMSLDDIGLDDTLTTEQTPDEKVVQEVEETPTVDGGTSTDDDTSETPDTSPDETTEIPAPTNDEIKVDGCLVDDVPEDVDQSTLSYISSVVNGFKYNYPVNVSRSMSECYSLGAKFIAENLKDGQMFSINIHTKALFIMIPECGIHLSADNPMYEYKEGTYTDDQKRRLAEHVRMGVILLGDHQVRRVVNKMAPAGVDVEVTLTLNINQFLAKVKDITAGQVSVSSEGVVRSPGTDLKALLSAEEAGSNRTQYVSLLNRALKAIGGSVEYLGDEEVEEEINKMQEMTRPIKEHNSNLATNAPRVDVSSIF